ncbi:MAG TPA: methyltransferase domain-containing protein [Anaerolineales bacterium]|nr:methyltransferase domain-containing protein [Anaerolineales bacterium]
MTTHPSTNVIYKQSSNEWSNYSAFITALVETFASKRVCDVGGGANPVLPLEFIIRHRIEYTLLDISAEELAKAPQGYRKIVQDIEAENLPRKEEFDFIVTKMMAEHIRNGRRFHKNVFDLLKPGGIAVHYFPTLYALPFIVNKITPEKLSSKLLNIFAPRERFRLGKFPAYYNWCYGPTPGMLNMLTGIGFEIVEFQGLIGHSYFDRVPFIEQIHAAYSSFLAKHPNPYLTSFAQIILRKPVKNQQNF